MIFAFRTEPDQLFTQPIPCSISRRLTTEPSPASLLILKTLGRLPSIPVETAVLAMNAAKLGAVLLVIVSIGFYAWRRVRQRRRLIWDNEARGGRRPLRH